MRKTKGFTLIEIILVIAILAILTTLIAPAYTGFVASSKQNVANSNAEILYNYANTVLYNDIFLNKDNFYGCKDGCEFNTMENSENDALNQLTEIMKERYISNNDNFLVSYTPNHGTKVYFCFSDNSTCTVDTFNGVYPSSSDKEIAAVVTGTKKTRVEATVLTSGVVTSTTKKTTVHSNTSKTTTSTTIKDPNAPLTSEDFENQTWIFSYLTALAYHLKPGYEDYNQWHPICAMNSEQLENNYPITRQDINNIINTYPEIHIMANQGQVEGYGDHMYCAYTSEDKKMPAILTDITNITKIDLWSTNNSWLGPLPNDIGKLVNLRSIYIHNYEYLNGAIPDSIGNCIALTSIVLHNTNISGALPKSMANLANLNTLTIYETQITSIPDELIPIFSKKHFSLTIRGSKDYPIEVSKEMYETINEISKISQTDYIYYIDENGDKILSYNKNGTWVCKYDKDAQNGMICE